jgi:hypothetical protein
MERAMMAKDDKKFGTVLIRCPTTGKPLATGDTATKEAYETGDYHQNIVTGCPHCGGAHVWSKGDSWLEMDKD